MTNTQRNSSRRSSAHQRNNPFPTARAYASLPGLILIALLILPVGGCHWTDEGRLPGYLYLRLNNNPTTLDPALITDVQGGGIAAKLFNGLVRFNENLDIIADIARSWRLSEDQLTYTFRLRHDARFSNGRKVTARDFQFSFERVLTPKTKAPLTWVLDKIEGANDFMAGRAAAISGIHVVDDHTLVLKLEKPFGPFLSLLAMTTAYVVPREEVERLGQDFGTHPIGSGPYVLAEWKHGQYLSLAAREDYFEGKPKLNGIYYRVIPEDLTAVVEFETGHLDVLLIPSSEYRRYTNDPAWRDLVFGRPGLNTYYLGLNCTRPPFNDVRVRRAVNMAIDRQHILNTVFEKRGALATGPIPPELWKGRTLTRTVTGYSYDPEKAKALIREAGAEGATVKIYITLDAEVLDIVEVIQNYLTKVGLKVEIIQLDWSALKHAVNEGEPDAFWLSWWADYPDPENFLFPLFHSASVGSGGNRTRCMDPELDRLIETAQRTMNEKQRYQLYRQAEDRIIKNAPWVFMWHRADYFVIQPWVKNFKIYPLYSIDKRVDITISR
ncbi:MAG TPA: ABC transporter substrate-binding protein [Nitrospirota bacterium]|nr:ABC transporter substrate-binding protein [Nitrospirota bacterium]